jgi:hypothetical protein
VADGASEKTVRKSLRMLLLNFKSINTNYWQDNIKQVASAQGMMALSPTQGSDSGGLSLQWLSYSRQTDSIY